MASFFRNIAAKMVANKNKIATIFVGHGLWSTISWIYDNPLYVAVIAKFGIVIGGAVMTFGSLVICLGMLVYYRNKQVHWLGYDVAAKALGEHINIQGKTFALMGDAVAFVVLSVWEDPFIATAYLRHGRNNGLLGKDYAIFFGSVLFSNGYWILRTTAIIEIAKYVWHLMF